MQILFNLTVILFSLISEFFPSEAIYNSLETGDLIFQGEDSSEFSKAISSSTASSDSIKYVHVGILSKTKEGEIWVVEASPENGVRKILLNDFIAESPKTEKGYLLSIKRLNFQFPNEDAIRRAEGFLGVPYDWWYLPGTDKIYCSELVLESFLDDKGYKIFPTYPMNFRNPDGSLPEFWENLFNELGKDVPEGVEGSNPNELSKDTRLIEVLNFF